MLTPRSAANLERSGKFVRQQRLVTRFSLRIEAAFQKVYETQKIVDDDRHK